MPSWRAPSSQDPPRRAGEARGEDPQWLPYRRWAGNLLIAIQRGFPSELFPCLLAADAEISFVTSNARDEKRLALADAEISFVTSNARDEKRLALMDLKPGAHAQAPCAAAGWPGRAPWRVQAAGCRSVGVRERRSWSFT
ncbi:unnamed protein product [Durusdinium trenchii]|uniref:Uncharacterized protein n=1 Tax=Durusdinium trenchii TaxID=1381693 RepID=A0ABP0QIS6_9DINO